MNIFIRMNKVNSDAFFKSKLVENYYIGNIHSTTYLLLYSTTGFTYVNYFV